MDKKVLLINGPNLNLLGTRETDIYGNESLPNLVQALHKKFTEKKITLLDFQSNSEGALVDFLQQNKDADFALINPAAYGHTSVALADAVKATQIPFVEVHISNVYAREDFRHKSYLSSMAQGVIVGCGMQGYFLASQEIKFTQGYDNHQHKPVLKIFPRCYDNLGKYYKESGLQ